MNRMHRPDEPILVLKRGGFEGAVVSNVHLDGADVYTESGDEEFVPFYLLFTADQIINYEDPPEPE